MSGILGNDLIGNFQPGGVSSVDVKPYVYDNFSSNASSYLKSTITSADTKLEVLSSSSFPSAPFHLAVDQEIMLVLLIEGNWFTVSRGIEGTTAATHKKGAVAANVISTGGFSTILSDRFMVGPEDQLPPAGVAGRVFQPTEANYRLIDDGTNWRVSYLGFTMPVSNIDPCSGTLNDALFMTGTTTKGGVNNFSFPNSTFKAAYYRKTYSATPCTLDTYLQLCPLWVGGSDIHFMGIGTKAANGYLTLFGITSLSAIFQIFVSNLTSDTGGSDVFSQTINTSRLFLRFNDDGANFNYSVSYDGIVYTTVYTQSRTWHGSTNAFWIWGGNARSDTRTLYSKTLFNQTS